MSSLATSRWQVVAAAVCFGTTGTAQALGPAGTQPLGVGSARILVGALLLLVIACATTGPGGAGAASRRPAARVLLPAGVGVAVYQLSFFAAVQRTGVGVGTVVAIGSGPAIAGLLGRAVNGEALTARWAAATSLAAAGVALLAVGSGGDASVDPAGLLLAVLAGAGYASYTVLAKRMLDAGHGPEHVMAATFATGAVLLLPVLAVAGGGLATPGGVALALYLGAVPTALAYALFARGLRRLGAGETATLTLAEPLTAALLGAVVLGERPGGAAIAGAALVLAGLLVLARPRGRARSAPAAAAAEAVA